MQPYHAVMPKLISGGLGAVLLPILVSPLAAYIFAIACDIRQNKLGQFAEDILIPPLGIAHGFILFFAG